ncbi:hypothetical protein B296_00046679 [Ensete ventricosum]|uniref:Uncharacterized protein n=1 Tax=Ensete ventricosum TaxID=4639 RepID=A0A426X604_ENSVE|nr:hypothetical protein B296_00046679 [Ensete ventricosum]
MSGGLETYPLDRKGPSRSRLMSSLRNGRFEGTARRGGRPTHGSLWRNALVEPMSPGSPLRQKRWNILNMTTC